MASAPVDIPIRVKGLSDLQKLEQKMEQLEREVSKLNAKLPKASNNIRGLGRSARVASKGFGVLNAAMIKIALVIGALQSASFLFVKTAELETQTKSIEVLTGSLEQTKKIIGELQDFSTITPFTGSELIETSKRLAAFGVETENLVDTTKRLADVSGATGARLQEVATAYGQIQAKGRLQGEELLQLQERGIALQDELKRMYGLSGQEFADAMRKGQIGAKSVEQAIINLTGESGKYFNGAVAQSQTLAGKWSTLIDAVTKLAQGLGQTLGPALKGVLDFAIAATNAIVGMINKVNQLLGIGTENAIAKLERDIESLEGRLGANGGRRDPMMRSQIAQKKKELEGLRAELEKTSKVEDKVTANLPYTGNLPPLLLPGGTGSGSGAGVDKAAKAADKLANDIERANQAAKDLTKSFTESAQPLRAQLEDQEKLNALMEGGKDLEAAQQRVDRERELLDIRVEGVKALEELREIENLGAAELAKGEEKIRAVVEERLALQKQLNQAKDATAAITGQEEQAEQAAKQRQDEIKQTAQDFASTIAGGFKNILVTAVKGGDIKQAFTQLIDGLANKFLDIAFKQIENSLTEAFTGLLGGEDRNNMQKQQIVQTEAQAIQMFGQYVTMFQSSVSQMGAMGGGGGGGLGGLFGGGGGIGGLFSGLAGGGIGGTVGLGGGMGSFMPLGSGFSVFEGGGYTGNGPRSGGLDGKGGYMAMVHPNETIVDHHGAMGRYSGGGGGGGGGSKTIRFESTVINSVEYVTIDQAQQMSRQAADDGAKRGAAGGHSKSMRTLQNSRSQRAKLGMS